MDQEQRGRIDSVINAVLWMVLALALGIVFDLWLARPDIWWAIAVVCIVALARDRWLAGWLGANWLLRIASSVGVLALMLAGFFVPLVENTSSGPRPDIQLNLESMQVDLKKRIAFLPVSNRGDRIASEVRVRAEPINFKSQPQVWPLFDLAPQDQKDAQFHLTLIDAFSQDVIPVQEWATKDGDFSFMASACTVFEGESFYTSEYIISCNLAEGPCEYQALPRAATYECLGGEGVVFNYYKETAQGGVIRPPAAPPRSR